MVKLCRAKLHDLTQPHALITEKDGDRLNHRCRECKNARDRASWPRIKWLKDCKQRRLAGLPPITLEVFYAQRKREMLETGRADNLGTSGGDVLSQSQSTVCQSTVASAS